MTFKTLHENLRQEILRRIDRGITSGNTLARAAGFQQPHLSNFLNQKRTLSLESVDRVMETLKLSVLDLLPADTLQAFAGRYSSASMTQAVPVVTHHAAGLKARMEPPDVVDMVQVPDAVLHFSRERPVEGRALWQRFVAIRVDGLQAAMMDPLLRQDSVAVIDRHYNSLAMYRSQTPSIYAVMVQNTLHLSFLEFDDGTLVLRPRNPHIPVRLVELAKKEQAGDRIVGRLCYLLQEF